MKTMNIELTLLDKTFEDLAWLRKHFSKIQEDYGNQCVAITDNSIIESAADKKSLFAKLKQKGIELSSVLVEYIPAKNEIVIF